jgi:hypothetical protein
MQGRNVTLQRRARAVGDHGHPVLSTQGDDSADFLSGVGGDHGIWRNTGVKRFILAKAFTDSGRLRQSLAKLTSQTSYYVCYRLRLNVFLGFICHEISL